MRHRIFCLCAAALLLCAAAAGSENQKAGSKNPKQRCEQAKLRAAGEYVECILRPHKQDIHGKQDASVDPTAQCDQQFDRAFARAEAGGACRTAGGPAALRGPLRAQAERTAGVIATGPGCQNLQIDPGKTATCILETSTSAIDLAALITQIQQKGETIDENTVFWIQAWGGGGAAGSGGQASPGGPRGYAQTTATLAGYNNFFSTTDLYYYLGVDGTQGPGTGGDGGTATVLSATDIFSAEGALPVLIAGGSGGGGQAGNDTDCYGALGGAGGIAIANSPNLQVVAGTQGGERHNQPNDSGHGGGGDVSGTGGASGGGNALSGDKGFAPLAGPGGLHGAGTTGFWDQTIPSGVILLRGGNGGELPSFPGGGGGGGWGAGGGGANGVADILDADACVSGGGGGGGSYATSLQGPSQQCSLAPTQAPASPNGRSYAQITFDLSATCH